MEIRNFRIEDDVSNIYYPYTIAQNVSFLNGKTLEEKITDIENHISITNYYYKEGNEIVKNTGGWIIGNHGINYVSKFEKNPTFMYLESSSTTSGDTSNCACNPILQIDVTNLQNICIDWENNGFTSTDNQSRFGLTDIKNGLPNIKLLTKQGAFTRTTSKIDVSTLTGCYWLEVCTKMINSQASKIKIYNIYGE